MTVPEEIDRIEEHLRRLAGRVKQGLTAASANLVRAAQHDVLRCLYQKGSLTVSQLAKELSVTASAVTSLSDRLVKSNLVQRMADKSDRRLVRLGLTPQGRELFEKVHAETLKRIRRYFQRVPQSEMQAFADILARLVHLMEEGSGQGEPAS